MNTPDKKYATIDDAAKWSGLSSRSIRRLIASGKLTAIAPSGVKRVLLDLEEFDRFIQSSAVAKPVPVATDCSGAGINPI